MYLLIYHTCMFGSKVSFPFMQEGLWASLDNTSQALVAYPCPPQYCQCALGVQGGTITCRFTFDSQNSDSQCTCDREGEPIV